MVGGGAVPGVVEAAGFGLIVVALAIALPLWVAVLVVGAALMVIGYAMEARS